MKDSNWNGGMNMGWENMKSYLIKVTDKFIQQALASVNRSSNTTVQTLANEKCMQRLEAVVDALSENMEDYLQINLWKSQH